MAYNFEDVWFCINCGYREFPPNVVPVDNDLHRWNSTICEKCHERKTIKGHCVCRICWDLNYRKHQPVE